MSKYVAKDFLITDYLNNPHFTYQPGSNFQIFELSKERKKIFKPLFMSLVFKKMIKMKRDHEIDIVQDYFYNLLPLYALKNHEPRLKYVISLVTRNIGWFLEVQRIEPYDNINYKLTRFLNIPPEYYCCKHADGIIVNALETKNDLVKYFKIRDKKIHVIPNAVDIDFFKKQHYRKKDLGFNTDAFLLLFVGNIFRQKGIFYLIESLHQVIQKYPSVNLIVIGTMHEYEKDFFISLIKRYKLEKNIIYYPHLSQTELLKFYSIADIFVFPSLYEGSPRVVQEAIACGCPVIATKISGIEIFDNTDNFIVYVNMKDPSDIARKIIMLIEDSTLRKELISRGLNHIQSNFNPSVIAKKTVEYYQEL